MSVLTIRDQGHDFLTIPDKKTARCSMKLRTRILVPFYK